MTAAITASMLYDLVSCPHRVRMDLFGDPAKRDPINPFIEMLSGLVSVTVMLLGLFGLMQYQRATERKKHS